MQKIASTRAAVRKSRVLILMLGQVMSGLIGRLELILNLERSLEEMGVGVLTLRVRGVWAGSVMSLLSFGTGR